LHKTDYCAILFHSTKSHKVKFQERAKLSSPYRVLKWMINTKNNSFPTGIMQANPLDYYLHNT